MAGDDGEHLERLDTPTPRSEAVARALMRQHGLEVRLDWEDLVVGAFFASILVVPLVSCIAMFVIMGFDAEPGRLWIAIGGAFVATFAIATYRFLTTARQTNAAYMRLFCHGSLVPARVTQIYLDDLADPDPRTVKLMLLATVDEPIRRYRWCWHSERGPCPAWGVEGGELRVFQGDHALAFLLPEDSAVPGEELRVWRDPSIDPTSFRPEPGLIDPGPRLDLPPARVVRRAK